MDNDCAEQHTLDLHLRGHDTRSWLEAKFVPLHDAHGRVVGILSTYQDVTARKHAEDEIARTRDRALSASRFKSDLLAKVSHDLRTPLNAIVGFAELIENGAYGPVSATQREALEHIIESTEALTDQVNELLDQSQLEAGTLKLKLTPFSPAQLVERTQKSMGVLAQSKGLVLTCAVDSGLPETLMGDQQRLQQILTNLVGNAIKFTTHGKVHVRAYHPDEAHWALEVSDTGPGIPSNALPYIFQPFWQVEYSTTRGYTGAGLGLSIVKQLATMMGGAVWVDSRLGQGSVFTVVLPFEPVREKIG
jgi:signal transduction histidine kinase